MKPMSRIAISQIECAVGEVDANVSKACQMVAGGAGQGAEPVLFPEILQPRGAACWSGPSWPSPYPAQRTTERFGAAAAEQGTLLAWPRETRDQAWHNVAVVMGPNGRLLTRYRKIYLSG